MPDPKIPSSANAGRYWLATMGLILALAGAGFTYGLYGAWRKAEQTRGWTPTPARIISAQVVSDRPSPNSNLQHRPEIRYRYTFASQSYTGRKIKRVDGPTAHETEAQKRIEPFPVGREITAYVNPLDPREAVLRHSSRAPLYSIWFPLLFVAGGLGMAWNALRRRTRR